MHDYNGQALAIGQDVTVTGRLVALDETRATIVVSAMPGTAGVLETIVVSPARVCLAGTSRSDRVFHEYPKVLASGQLAQSKAHELDLLAGDAPVDEPAAVPAKARKGRTAGKKK